MYNFNEELCRQLSNGDIACKYDNGNLEMLRALLKKCAPKYEEIPDGILKYYWIDNLYNWDGDIKTTKPTVPLSDFIVNDSEDMNNCNTWSDKTKVEFFDYALKNTSAFKDIGEAVEQFKAYKQRTCLFITEDGKQIFKGDVYWYVEVDNNFDITRTTACSSEQQIPECKDFSTEAAAIEYVRLNKPMYSLNDIGDAWEKLCHEAFTYDQLITELEKLKQ